MVGCVVCVTDLQGGSTTTMQVDDGDESKVRAFFCYYLILDFFVLFTSCFTTLWTFKILPYLRIAM